MQRIQGLESLVNLNQLWLGRNRISEITNLSTLTNLRQISLQANRLESMQVRAICTPAAGVDVPQCLGCAVCPVCPQGGARPEL